MTWLSNGRVVSFVVPYDELADSAWTEEGVKVKINIRPLLRLILPSPCLGDKDCCASRFCQEEPNKLDERKPEPAREEPTDDEIMFTGCAF